MDIKLELYKVFYSVAKNQNITKAANELMISQPGVSKAIKNLEDQLGCPLFIRTRSGVLLTEEGKTFYEQIKQVMEMIDRAEQTILKMVDLEYGFLNIGISNTLTKKYLLPYIEKFHKMYPKIKIKLYTDPTFSLITKARDGLLDFIILNLPYNIPDNFCERNLIDVHDCFVANENFSELKDKVVPLNELNSYPLILISKGSSTRRFLDNFCAKYNVTLNPEIELTSYSLVTEFSKIGLGIGIATKEYLDNELEDGTLFEVKTEPELVSRSVGIIYLKNKILSCCAKRFIELLEENKKS